jgi:integrase
MKKREADRAAAKWEAELQEGRYQKPSRMSWEEFRLRYEEDGMGSIRPQTIKSYLSTLNVFEKYCSPRLLAEATTTKVTAFARELRLPRTEEIGKGSRRQKKTSKRSEACVAKHLRQLRAVLGWACRQEFLSTCPSFDMPKRGSGARRMKGRPITLEEFERMLAVTPKVVGEEAADSWLLLLHGLWTSGLRLGEAMSLRWDGGNGGVAVILDGKKSVLAFDADSQKSGKVELVPLAPEAVGLLEPFRRRSGFVFRPLCRDGEPMTRDTQRIGRVFSRIGEAASVVVDPAKGKCASAHDLRRAFGYRWSRLVMPPQLRELMRHARIDTTMTYYVGQNAQATSEELWAALGSNLGSICLQPPGVPLPKQAQVDSL